MSQPWYDFGYMQRLIETTGNGYGIVSVVASDDIHMGSLVTATEDGKVTSSSMLAQPNSIGVALQDATHNQRVMIDLRWGKL